MYSKPYTPRQRKRILAGLTQATLAHELGIDRSLLSRWETYQLTWPEERVRRIAARLDVPAEELLAEPGEEATP